MRAMVFTAPNTVEMLDVAVPTIAEGDVTITVRAAGICGSELHGIRHTDFRKPPLVMGHELAGVDQDGRRVTVNPLLSCGMCDRCSANEEHLCRGRLIIGIHRPGAFAETVVVPKASVYEIPDSMTFETAAMVEPLANAVHALRLADPAAGSRIAVLGAGTIGLVSLLVALEYSMDVTVCDLSESRLKTALELGAIRSSTELTGEYDLIIDAVGAESTHRTSVERLRPGGTAVWIGLLSSSTGFDGQEIVRDEKRVLGSYCYTRSDFERALSLAEHTPLDWTTRFPLELGATIFTELMDGRQDVIKALLCPAPGPVKTRSLV
ncbi:zinc-dependent alcohol dehydrogenase [Rhodococcus sp. OK302]|uniref:zinc-dependent alcohol dehydrogenase n=1 Tax=Rhodococcus sp. OK302 TaxID=1882769 RepID=UPI000B93C74C|nr:alcohol dehydrogenase catalytic domain-containing protein [Rhodococcus sp. OK302]OYD61120.1 threonine dehydrogenase-like Zn-dependent dehydrogenase [Rhodococcus sp. OK302]